MSGADTQYFAVLQFLIREARLLDAGDWRSWIQLFTADALYWMPLEPGQSDRMSHASLICDDGALRELRCRRWEEQRLDTGAMSLQPTPRAMRHLTNLSVFENPGVASLRAEANVLWAEYARGAVSTLHAHVTWQLQPDGGAWLIAGKRVDLLNAGGGLSDILTYL